VSVTLSNFDPTTGYALVLDPGSISLGAGSTNGSGSDTTSVTIPSDTSPGSGYTVVASGTIGGGPGSATSASLTVTAASATVWNQLIDANTGLGSSLDGLSIDGSAVDVAGWIRPGSGQPALLSAYDSSGSSLWSHTLGSGCPTCQDGVVTATDGTVWFFGTPDDGSTGFANSYLSSGTAQSTYTNSYNSLLYGAAGPAGGLYFADNQSNLGLVDATGTQVASNADYIGIGSLASSADGSNLYAAMVNPDQSVEILKFDTSLMAQPWSASPLAGGTDTTYALVAVDPASQDVYLTIMRSDGSTASVTSYAYDNSGGLLWSGTDIGGLVGILDPTWGLGVNTAIFDGHLYVTGSVLNTTPSRPNDTANQPYLAVLDTSTGSLVRHVTWADDSDSLANGVGVFADGSPVVDGYTVYSTFEGIPNSVGTAGFISQLTP
jgi:hypothetical protein